jgi:cytochrome c556
MARQWRLGAVVAVAIGMAVAAGGALAQSGAEQVKIRQQHFKDQGKAFKAVVDELKKDSPDKALIAANADKLKASSSQLPTWFPKGSGAETGVKTAAKPEVWADAAGFAAAAERFKAEGAKFDETAHGGDLDAIKAGARALGGACKNCHDKYRVPDKT